MPPALPGRSSQQSASGTVIVLGAGVIGLTTAVLLLERGFTVRVIASTIPSAAPSNIISQRLSVEERAYRQCSSVEAGAHWCSFASPSDNRLARYEVETLRVLERLTRYPQTGVMPLKSVCLYRHSPAGNIVDPWFHPFVSNYRRLDVHEVPAGYPSGFTFTTVTVAVNKYLSWLMDQIKLLGGTLEQRTIHAIDELCAPGIAAIVNCTGLGSRYLGGVKDLDVYPVRGQTLLCRQQSGSVLETVTRIHDSNDEAAYVIPRQDGTVLLGGTFEPFSANTRPHPETAKKILDRCHAMMPSLKELTVVRHGVGLRPARKGGIRVEIDTQQRSNNVAVIHNYGHGGYGYQTSWATAAEACDLVVKSLERPISKL